MAEPVNKEKLRTVLGKFMESIEEWQSMIEGSPTKADFASLDDIYNDTIDQLDTEYFKNINQAQTEYKASIKNANNPS